MKMNNAHETFKEIRKRAKALGKGTPFVLNHYVLEKFLERLSKSRFKKVLILKGASLIYASSNDEFNRNTKDLDFLYTENKEKLEEILLSICKIENADGLGFDLKDYSFEKIKFEDSYGGVRFKTTVYLGETKIRFQADVAFHSMPLSETVKVEYPSILKEGVSLRLMHIL